MRGSGIVIFGAGSDEAETYSRAFHTNGLNVTIANWAEEARRLSICASTKVVILDIERIDEDPMRLLQAAPHGIFVLPEGSTPIKAAMIRQGADVILTKPLDMEELILRVRRLLRPTDLKKPLHFDLGALSIDGMSRSIVRRDGSLGIPLTLAEVNMLRLLATNVGVVVSRQALHDAAFGDKVEKTSRALDTAMSRLRAKVKDADIGFSIISARSAGYFINRNETMPAEGGEFQLAAPFAS